MTTERPAGKGTKRTAPRRASPGPPHTFAELRQSRGMTQAALARRLGISQAAVSGMERSNPAVATVRRYVEALGGELELYAVFDEHSYQLEI